MDEWPYEDGLLVCWKSGCASKVLEMRVRKKRER